MTALQRLKAKHGIRNISVAGNVTKSSMDNHMLKRTTTSTVLTALVNCLLTNVRCVTSQ